MGRAGVGAVRGRGASALSDRVHLFGASGSGTTTLGRRLASATGGRHLDADTYYWFPTDPSFTTKREPEARVAAIERDVADLEAWVLSGSICNWGDPLLSRFTLAVFPILDPGVRMARLPCPVLRLDASGSVETLCDQVVARIGP